MILVTGGTGFIGSTVILQLLTSGKSVRALKRIQSTIPVILKDKEGIEWVNGDLLDYYSLKDAFVGITHVYHCAAMVSYVSSDKIQLMRTNVEGTTHIVNLCVDNSCRLLYVSSVAALGDNERGKPISEKTPWTWSKEKSNYSISKYEAEREVWRGMSEGLNAVIVNPSVVIGASVEASESGKIFELLEKGFSFFPAGGTGFVDVDDVAKIMIKLMNREDISEDNFIINNENLSYQELFSRYAEVSKKKAPVYLLSKSVLAFVWRLSFITKKIGLKNVAITKEVARASSKNSFYSNQKVLDTLQYSFKSLKISFQEIHSSL